MGGFRFWFVVGGLLVAGWVLWGFLDNPPLEESGTVQPEEVEEPDQEESAPVELTEVDALLRNAHFLTHFDEYDLSGRLRRQGSEAPFTIYVRGENAQLHLYDRKSEDWDSIHLRVAPNGPKTLRVQDRDFRAMTSEEISEPLGEFVVSCEDVLMPFLFWQGGLEEGREKLKGQQAIRVRLVNRSEEGAYAQLRVWLHEKTGALMQVVGYNAEGQPLKRLLVSDLMKARDVFTPRRLRVDTIDPSANRVVDIAYLEFEKPALRKPGIGD